MKTINATKARTNLFRLMDEAAGDPLLITGRRNNAVLVLEEDWNAIQETLHLVSVPGLRESILEGKETPLSECSEDVEW
jgi:antitoxin YefM